MNNDPDYSAAYVILRTDHPAGLEGHGLTFTIGRGNEICVAAIRALSPLVIGHTLESFAVNMRAFWRHLTGDSQLRWIGPESTLMLDANQVWEVNEAIVAMQPLADFDPLWIEEPTSPDDILGHAAIARAVAPIRVATGEHVQNRIIFKQLFQANAIGICQIDACRVGGVNEVLAILLMAAHFGIPVCPHAGGVGLCEYVQHLSIFDYIVISGSLENRMIEYTPHLHEHFIHPAIIKDGHYVAPSAPGYSVTMYPTSLAAYSYPEGSEWAKERRKPMQRIGRLIGLKPDQVEAYERLHAAVWPEVLATIAACNIRNYSIFRYGEQLFAYFEYVGNDFEADMAKMATDPKTRE